MIKDNKLFLSTPLRVTWTISKNKILAHKIAKELIISKIFFVKLNLDNNFIFNDIAETVNNLTGNAVRVSLQININSIDRILSSGLINLKFDRLIIEIQTPRYLQNNQKKLAKLNSLTNIPIAISITLNNSILNKIPVLIENIKKHGFKEIIFLNPEIAGKKIAKKEKYAIQTLEWENFKNDIKKCSKNWGKDINFIVHDYFMWKEFSEYLQIVKSSKGEYSGCQAANVLAYIAQNGDVYPCASMPIKIGNLENSTLGTIWGSLERKQLYSKINKVNELCINCTFSDCKGGCKGIVYFLDNTFNSQDRLCPFRNKQSL